MALNQIFFVYMALAGAAAGAILVAAPHVQDFVIKPYFWVLIAVGLFDGGIYLLAGFGIGIALMVAIPLLAGTQIRFL